MSQRNESTQEGYCIKVVVGLSLQVTVWLCVKVGVNLKAVLMAFLLISRSRFKPC